ncbi:MAG: hypothetical protein AAF628_23665 [Planctomycetota bacterium]
MTETAVLLGPRTSPLVGVVCDPPGGAGATHDVACLFLNAGFTHRVGPQRLHVRVARRLAAMGVPSLRFDYSGVGDSGTRSDATSMEDSTIEEAQEAMRFMTATRGVQRFVLIGVCWGADNALRVCGADPRVAAVAAIDFYSVYSFRYFVRTHKSRLLDPRSLGSLFLGRSAAPARLVAGLIEIAKSRRAKRRAPTAQPQAADAEDGMLPVRSPDSIVKGLRGLVDRGAQILMVYARGAPSFDQYQMHFRRPMAELERSGRFRVEVFAHADHVFTRLRNQAWLIELLLQWVSDMAVGAGTDEHVALEARVS